MCLDKKGHYLLPRRKEGWKVFSGDLEGRLFGFIMSITQARPEGKWIREKDYRENWSSSRIRHGEDFDYETGFHIFLEKPKIVECRTMQIRKVKFRKVVARGYQVIEQQKEGEAIRELVKIVVAKEIFILPR